MRTMHYNEFIFGSLAVCFKCHRLITDVRKYDTNVEAIDISYAFSASKSLTYQFICISFSLPLTSFRFACDELHTVCRLPNLIVIFHGYKYELRASDELRNDC